MKSAHRMAVEPPRPAGVRAANPSPGELQGTARPLPEGVRARMEAAFGADFSHVTVREDGEAGAVGAVAFTRGTEITVDPGAFDPHSAEGLEMLGHELAHVLQQRDGRVQGTGVTEEPALEQEATEAGRRASQGRSVPRAASGFEAGPSAAPAGGPLGPADAAAAVAQPMKRRSSSPRRRSSYDPANNNPPPGSEADPEQFIGPGGDVLEYQTAPDYVDEGYGEQEYSESEPYEYTEPPVDFEFSEFEVEDANFPPDYDPEVANTPPSILAKQARKERRARRQGVALPSNRFGQAWPRGAGPRRNFLAGHRRRG